MMHNWLGNDHLLGHLDSLHTCKKYSFHGLPALLPLPKGKFGNHSLYRAENELKGVRVYLDEESAAVGHKKVWLKHPPHPPSMAKSLPPDLHLQPANRQKA